MAVEVNSYLPDGPLAHHYRLILQGASIVRVTNVPFNAYKEKKNFGFVAVIINDIRIADRYSGLLYRKVGRKARTFMHIINILCRFAVC